MLLPAALSDWRSRELFLKRLKSEAMAFYKSSPTGHRDCVAKHVIKKKKKGRKKQTVKMNWDHPVIGQTGLPAVLRVFKSHCFCSLTFLQEDTVHKISNCQANHSRESDPLFRRDLSPLNILFYWCYGKKLETHKESTVVLVKTQVRYKELWERSPTSQQRSCQGGIRWCRKVNCFTAVLQGRHLAWENGRWVLCK